ncbi:MAG: oligosaccharide flippase family protein [Lachnospiraceae bacterium]|nr:oligosaccharide flippase family protein [Lachnospiraceae bacterium]
MDETNRKKSMARNAAILTIGKICTQGISFLMLPLYTSVLDTTEYGVFDLLVTYATLLLPLVNMQIDQGFFRYMLDVRNKQDEQKRLFTTVISGTFAQAIFFLLLFCLIVPFLLLNHSWFLLLYVVTHLFTAVLLQFARGLGEIRKYAFASFLSAGFTVIFNLITLVPLRMGLSGLFLSTILAQVITMVYLLIATKSWKYFLIKKFDRSLFSKVCKYSFPLVPNNLAWWVVNSSDRLVISHFIGVAANGIFTVASKFSNVFITFYNVVNLSWTETVSLHYDDEDRDEFLSEMMTTMFGLFSSACFVVVALMPFIYPLLVNVKYRDGYNQVLILMYAMLFRVLVGMYSCIYIATKQSKKVAITSISAAVINLLCDLLLVNKIGLYAASISSLIAFSIMFIIRFFDVNRTVKMRIERKIACVSFLVGAIVLGAYYSNRFALYLTSLFISVAYALFANRSLIKSVWQMLRFGHAK